MAAGIDPIYCRAPHVEWGKVTSTSSPVLGTTALTSLVASGSTLGTDIFTVFTADADNGGYVTKLRFKPGINNTATVGTSARVWLNNGSTPSTLGATVFLDDITLPASTSTVSAASPTYELPLDLAIQAGYRILVSFSTVQTSTGWQVCAIGGQY